MADTEGATAAIASAAAAIDQAASQKAVDLAGPVIDAAIAHAASEVQQANDAARQLAAAFEASENGRRIVAAEKGLDECRTRLASLQAELTQGLANLSSQMGTWKTELAAAIATASATTSQLTPQPSESGEAPETVKVIEPLESAVGAVQEAVERPVQKVRRFL